MSVARAMLRVCALGILALGAAPVVHAGDTTQRTAPVCEASFAQTGIASWYGGRFHGRRTASGEIFDTTALTVAHPTLPMGSMVEVTNLANGRSAVARVNDRGPFIRNRIVDCSRAVANLLGFVRCGVTRVGIRVLDGAAPAEAATVADATPAGLGAPPTYCVQIGAFRNPQNAAVVVRRASVVPFPVFVQAARALQRVLVGPFGGRDEAEAARNTLRTAGLVGQVRETPLAALEDQASAVTAP